MDLELSNDEVIDLLNTKPDPKFNNYQNPNVIDELEEEYSPNDSKEYMY
jgi:hypothetical protein